MLNRKKAIIGAGGVAVALTMALAALGPTGAYFSDTAQGELTGTDGSIKVETSGGSGADHIGLTYENLLPGETQSVKATFKNTGANAQDVWVVFNDDQARAALNDLGSYGEFHISSYTTANIFDSTNLRDSAASGCAPTVNGCWPLGKQYKLQSNLAVNATGNVNFTFGYAAKLGNTAYNNGIDAEPNTNGGGVWNADPLAAPTTSGLPYQIVATQVGHEPGDLG
jgi:hypothetical protein